MLSYLHKPLETTLVIDRAGNADGLMSRAEVSVAANLHGDVAAQPAEGVEFLTRRGFCQLPPDMQLDRTLGRAAAAFHDEASPAICCTVSCGRSVTLTHVGAGDASSYGLVMRAEGIIG